MTRRPSSRVQEWLPARAARTGIRQISVSLTDDDAVLLEGIRRKHGDRGFGETVRRLIRAARQKRSAR